MNPDLITAISLPPSEDTTIGRTVVKLGSAANMVKDPRRPLTQPNEVSFKSGSGHCDTIIKHATQTKTHCANLRTHGMVWWVSVSQIQGMKNPVIST